MSFDLCTPEGAEKSRAKWWHPMQILGPAFLSKGQVQTGIGGQEERRGRVFFFFFCPLAPQAPILLDLKSTVVKPGEWRYRTLTYVKYK